MKKVLLFAAFAAFAMTSVNAQDSGFAKSDIYMTGTVGFNSGTIACKYVVFPPLSLHPPSDKKSQNLE